MHSCCYWYNFLFYFFKHNFFSIYFFIPLFFQKLLYIVFYFNLPPSKVFSIFYFAFLFVFFVFFLPSFVLIISLKATIIKP